MFCGPANKVWGCRSRPDGMPQDGVAKNMVTPEMLPDLRHMNDVLISNLVVRIEISTRITLKGGGD